MSRSVVSKRTLWAFIGPAIFVLAVVGIVPLVYAVYTSLHYFNLTDLGDIEFIWFENYADVLTDDSFWGAMGRTFLLLLIALPVQIAPRPRDRPAAAQARADLSQDLDPPRARPADGHDLRGGRAARPGDVQPSSTGS